MLVNNTLYLSRSAIEDYLDCGAFYRNRYHELETGIVPSRPNRYLEMGTAIHKGLETVLEGLLPGPGQIPADQMSTAVWNAVAGHLYRAFQGWATTEGEVWTLNKDVALCYGLVMVFCYQNLPEWKEQTWWIERDVSIEWHSYPIGSVNNTRVVFESKADYVGYNQGETRFKLFNFKSTKVHPETDGRADKSFKHDLQGITESYCIEETAKRDAELISWGRDGLTNPVGYIGNKVGQIDKALATLQGKLSTFVVDSVSYIMFIKGMEKNEYDSQGNPTGRVYNDSPLVEGYRTRAGGGVQYAWTKKIKKVENESGYGYLGKNWEKFYPWEDSALGSSLKERMDGWISYLRSGIQEEEGDPLAQLVVLTPEKYRSGADQEKTIKELKRTAKRIIEDYQDWKNGDDGAFVRNRGNCTYPTECVYRRICFGGLTPEGMVAAGDMKLREPHHKRERGEWEKLVQIKKGTEKKGEGNVFPKY